MTQPSQHIGFKLAITLLLAALVACAWTQVLDHGVSEATLDNFKRALSIAALARAFNGVISVAQGTEIAVQPVGVGVTLTLGEILDPLNDLVERFSGLALIASVSLLLQHYLTDIAATYWLSGLLSAMVLAYLIRLWWPTPNPVPASFSRVLGLAIFARFLLVVVLLISGWISDEFLVERQEHAVTQLSNASEALEAANNQPIQTLPTNDSFLDRTADTLSSLLDSSRQTLDVNGQLEELQERVEASVEDMIELIVIFLLQTLLLPLASLWLCWWALRGFWRWSGTETG